MPPHNRSPIPASSAASDREAFDYRKADDFYQKSLSEHTREAYRRVVREFFTAHRDAHPAEITPKQALAWRDSLVKKKQKPHTVAFKLSIVRSFYEYLRAAGVVMLNPGFF
jgi:site-specific recombinase XerD